MTGLPGPAFEVVTLALSPRRDVERFCRHYLAQGASHIRIYCDGGLEWESGDPRIELIACDTAFWSSLGSGRPFSIEERQRTVFRDAYARCDAEWCLIVDIDELVIGPIGLAGYLPGLDASIHCVRFATAEAVFLPGDDTDAEFAASGFRLPARRMVSPLLALLLYSPHGSLFVRGLLGHSRGKQAVRHGIAGIAIGIHDASVPGEPRFNRHDASRSDDFWLAHYDAISFPRWSEKCRQRMARRDALEMGRKRERQITLFEGCATEKQRRTLFEQLYGLKWWQVTVLRLTGLFRHRPAQLEVVQPGASPIRDKDETPPVARPAPHSIRG